MTAFTTAFDATFGADVSGSPFTDAFDSSFGVAPADPGGGIQDCGNDAPLTNGWSRRGRLYASNDWVVITVGSERIKKLREDWCP